jgi:hypothetical protein
MREVGLRSLEEQPIPGLEFAGYLEKLRRFLLLLLRCATPSSTLPSTQVSSHSQVPPPN